MTAEIPDDHDQNPVIAMESTLVSDDEGEDNEEDIWDKVQPIPDGPNPLTSERERILQCMKERDETSDGPPPTNVTDFDLNGPETEQEQEQEVNLVEEDEQPTNLAAEILRIHHRMGHAPFSKLQEMARQGALPTRLKNCPIPVCTACLYGKAGKKPWRGKERKDKAVKSELRVGDVTSVDQMNSSTPGLVAQISGILTTKRYKCATVFVDQAT
jgi:hypothetical protein